MSICLISASSSEDTCFKDLGNVKVFKSATKAEVANKLGEFVINAYSEFASSDRNKFTVALSGGSLPEILALGLVPIKNEIDFSKWEIFFADERHVPLDHDESNYKVCNEAFMKQVGVPAENIHPIDAGLSVNDAALAYEMDIMKHVERDSATDLPRFDLIFLGMGPDGHTCSLFPGHPLLSEESRMVAPIEDSPKPPPKRITLTFPVLNSAKNVFFVATGESKADTLTQAIITDDELISQGDRALPAARVRAPKGNVIWFIDDAAGSRL